MNTTTILSLSLLTLAAACADQALTSDTEQAVSKADLTKQGYDCQAQTAYGKTVWECTKCDSEGNCTAYFCDDGATSCDDSFTIHFVANNTYDHDLNYWFEAESATLTSPMQRLSSASASGGTYISVPPTAAAGGSARFTFTAPIAAPAMYAWARVIAPSTSSNAVTIAFDGHPVAWSLPVTNTWTWVRLPNVAWSVSQGAHTLVLTRDEPDVRIDRLLLTANDELTPTVATYEAESAAIVAPMQVGGSLFTTHYIYAPTGSGPGGLAQLDTAVSQVGGYGIWGLVSAASSATNSFSIDESFGTQTTWNLPVTGTAWAWSKAPIPFALDGSSFLEIHPLEAGAKLDKLIITNDPGFVPVSSTMVNAPN